jgi:3-isopropylmalate/(R)-2-methylmalate dehydratase small subunit
LQDAGFRAVLSPRFADIFRGNALKNGLLPVVLPADVIESLMTVVEADPSIELVVDLTERQVRCGSSIAPFDVDDHTRARLLEGLDDIALTLRHSNDITAFETVRPAWLPSTQAVR